MHHCLHIEEILALIVEFVGGPLAHDKRSVLALAKTWYLLFRVGQPYYGRWEKVQELIQCS
jgi:hypothetical protein